MLKVLDLFSGIGGFSLGLERAGMETVAFCEYDEKCREVLTKHWPDVPQYTDVRTLTGEQLENDGITDIGLICGGYPCQPFSVAGKRQGEADDRHLWPEFFRLIKEIRPAYVLCENVAGHINIWASTVCWLTWKVKPITSKHFLYQLVPSVPTTGETDSGLLPTPTTQEIEHPEAELTESGRRKTKDGKNSHSLNLADTVRMWPTPCTRDYKGGRKLETLKAAGRDEKNSLPDAVNVANQATGSLNPTWVEPLMGFPIGWTDIAEED